MKGKIHGGRRVRKRACAGAPSIKTPAKGHRAYRNPAWHGLLLACVFLFGCSPQYRGNLDLSMENRIFWPGPPEKPKIGYLWSLSSLAQEGKSALDVLAGSDSHDLKTVPYLMRPMSIYQRGERLYIADPGAARVTVVNLSSMEVFHMGVSGQGELAFPVSVVADREGYVYVSDSTIRKVLKYDRSGSFVAAIFSDGRPVGLAYDDGSDTLYVSDASRHTIHALDRNGSVRFTIGSRGAEEGEFNYPTYLWVDGEGRLYVSDTLNSRIQVFDSHGRFLSTFGVRGDAYQELAGPKGVAVDASGNIFVVDSKQGMVKIFNGSGRLLLFFGDEGTGYGKFNLPNGIFIAGNTLYVADTYNMRVQAFQFIEKSGD
jgi:sugar lactone lactonase YvrE